MSLDHDHHDHAGHSHGAANYGKAFAIGVSLNLTYVIVQVVFGIRANSVALLADAAHNLSDVPGLALAWGAIVLAKRRPTQRFTYGLRGSSILAALANGAFLLLVTGGIVWEAVQRIAEPAPVSGNIVIAVHDKSKVRSDVGDVTTAVIVAPNGARFSLMVLIASMW